MADKVVNLNDSISTSVKISDLKAAANDKRKAKAQVSQFAKARKINDTYFDGSKDITVSLPLVELTNEDLNILIACGIDYYADYSNSCSNRPTNVDAFGLRIINIGAGHLMQELYEANNGKIWTRIFDGKDFTNWQYMYSSDIPQEIPAVNKFANQLTYPRTIQIEGVVNGSTVFDGSKNVTITLDHANHIGDDMDTIVIKDGSVNFGGLNPSEIINIGDTSIDERPVPTDYYFGGDKCTTSNIHVAKLHAIEVYENDVNIRKIYSDINHNHDEVYSKLDHTHQFKDLTIPSTFPNPQALTIKLNGSFNCEYDGTMAFTVNIDPDSVGAAWAEHGQHVLYSTDTPRVSKGAGSAGTTTEVARADHVHPLPEWIKYSSILQYSNYGLANTPYSDVNIGGVQYTTSETSKIGFGTTATNTNLLWVYSPTEEGYGTYQLGVSYDTAEPTRPIVKMRGNTAKATSFGNWYKLAYEDQVVKQSSVYNKIVNDKKVRAALGI